MVYLLIVSKNLFGFNLFVAKNKSLTERSSIRLLVAGVGFEPHGLRVMSPTSYQAALPRDIVFALPSKCLSIIQPFAAFVNDLFAKK